MIVCTDCGNSGETATFSIDHTCTAAHLKSAYGHATYGNVFAGRGGALYVGAYWTDGMLGQSYANVPADKVVCV